MKKHFNTKYVVITGGGDPIELDTGIYPKIMLDVLFPPSQLNQILNAVKGDSKSVAWIVNNDTTMSHINNLILLGKEKNEQLSLEQGYEGLYIEPKDISVYEMESSNELTLLELGEFGYIIPWMSKYLEALFDKTITIQNTIAGEME